MESPAFSRVEHIGIAVADPNASAEWYRRVLDFQVVFSNGDEPPTLLVSHPSGFVLEIMPKTDRPQPVRAVRDPGLSHIALQVDDLDRAADVLKSRGLAFDGDVVSAVGGGRILNFSDLDGNMLQIVERPAT